MTIETSLGIGPGTPPGAEFVQLLTPEGERIEHPEYSVDLGADELRATYRDLVLVRRIDTEATALQRKGELGLWASLLGQEAAQIGSVRALHPEDMVFPSYRDHGAAWCRGVAWQDLLKLFRGVSHGGWDPQANNFHLYSIVVGSQPLHAAGYAMGMQRDGADSAAMVYFGDGAMSQGDTNEALVWATVFNAPIVFFCQNNQWAISEPAERQSRIPLYQRAQGFGLPGIRVDGNDVLAVMAVTRSVLQAARDGQGPTLVEALTYRVGAHTTADDPTRYRMASELESWQQKDPIERLRAYLFKQELADQAFIDSVDAEADSLGARIRETCVQLPDPPPLSMFDHVHAEEHPLVAEEREEFSAYLDSFADSGGPAAEEGDAR